MPPDVDIIVIADQPRKLLAELNQVADKFLNDSYFLTVNIITLAEYERLVQSLEPMAPKRLLVVRQLMVLAGNETISRLKGIAQDNYGAIDRIVQEEYDDKKAVLRQLREDRADKYVLTRDDYARLYPYLLDEMEGKRIGGFNVERIKFVYPQPMDLKYRVDIERYQDEYLD